MEREEIIEWVCRYFKVSRANVVKRQGRNIKGTKFGPEQNW